MKIIYMNKTYECQLDDNLLTQSLVKSLPVTLTLMRAENHEYYGSLPKDMDVTNVPTTSYVDEGGIYYFKAWNAFSLNFNALDINPYKVQIIGTMDQQLTQLLKKAPKKIDITLENDE